VQLVAEGIGADKRIGRAFLNAGIGYGGSCFPKDLAAFTAISDHLGVPFRLLKEVHNINVAQLERFVKSIHDALWVLQEKRIAVWGLSFKPHTDDVRSSVPISLIETLLADGAQIVAYDPKAMDNVRTQLPELAARIALVANPLDAVDRAEALIIATEWPEFAEVDYEDVKRRMVAPMVFDGRNLLDPRIMRQLGFQYFCVGRNAVKEGAGM
jgi:UDPglucose 6-dehydrogenase